ncbi:peptidase T [Paenibacillus sp. PAMC21692]|uniref:peptidase T n=1 Tax=Paenibacillus sp. PAMC21692 TaxID=2762320 RepID=UPI00164CE8EB|nr:peptidase T [Paenibacillus sp. PAMC21692]QNK60418.1 peptidase T [Paenibacillus sp. PAMC21692]
MKQELISRLTTYVQVDTQSDENSESCPSTPGQMTLLRMLVEELKSIGMADVTIDDNGYVMATLPANTDKEVPTIGFLAHVDTATDMTGANVNPQVVDAYDGSDIVLNAEQDIVLSSREFPALSGHIGSTLMTTDGTTLLGADDKAGLAEIMTAMAYLIAHPEIKHGKIRVAFTPDEEIGRGAHKFDVAAFGAEYAYTMDGGPLGELQYESFNAASAIVTINGKNVHPGTAKDKMINATKLAMEFHAMLPPQEVPEHTEGYEGFYHLNNMAGDVEQMRLHYLIRDHNREKFDARKAEMTRVAEAMAAKYGEQRIVLELKVRYYNMGEKIEPVFHIVEIAREAMESLGIKPLVEPIRGGTDGSQLSFMGLPTPNLFTGGENYHGRYEYVSVDTMELAVKTIIEIVKRYEARA